MVDPGMCVKGEGWGGVLEFMDDSAALEKDP